MVGLAGCGFGPGEDRGSARLVVTSDYGGDVLIDEPVDGLTETSTAMRILDDSAELETRYGGGFVQAVDGVSGRTSDGRRSDWFYSVNGVVADRGAAELTVEDGDRVWWDYRDWTDAMEVGAVVGSFPAPMVGGYDGATWPVRVDCFRLREVCSEVESKLRAEGARLASDPEVADGPPGSAAGDARADGRDGEDVVRFMVGPWGAVGESPEAGSLERGPARSGVFARFEVSTSPVPAGDGRERSPNGAAAAPHLIGLDQRAEAVRDFGPDAGLVAAMRRGDGPPVWLVTGGSAAGVGKAANALDQTSLRNRYAAIVTDGRVVSLPLP